MARIATNTPVNGTIEIGGPEQFRLDELARRFLAAHQDPRDVISDPHGRYYGIEVSKRALVPDNDARLGETRFETWLTQSASDIASAPPQPAVSVAAGKQESRKRSWLMIAASLPLVSQVTEFSFPLLVKSILNW